MVHVVGIITQTRLLMFPKRRGVHVLPLQHTTLHRHACDHHPAMRGPIPYPPAIPKRGARSIGPRGYSEVHHHTIAPCTCADYCIHSMRAMEHDWSYDVRRGLARGRGRATDKQLARAWEDHLKPSGLYTVGANEVVGNATITRRGLHCAYVTIGLNKLSFACTQLSYVTNGVHARPSGPSASRSVHSTQTGNVIMGVSRLHDPPS